MISKRIFQKELSLNSALALNKIKEMCESHEWYTGFLQVRFQNNSMLINF